MEGRLGHVVEVGVVGLLAAGLGHVPRVDRQHRVPPLLLSQVRVAEVVQLKPGHGIAHFQQGRERGCSKR